MPSLFPEIEIGRYPIDGPRPFRVEYPFGRPGDGFRRFAEERKATCVAYHRGVDPRLIAHVRGGNEFQYDVDDDRHKEMVKDMRDAGFRGGNGQRLIIYVTIDDIWLGEGNHRRRAALEAEVPKVELEIRYLNRADEIFLLIPFELDDPEIKFISD